MKLPGRPFVAAVIAALESAAAAFQETVARVQHASPRASFPVGAQGISFAEKFRETNNYHRQWPTAYGLERVICAQGGPCTKPLPMPKEQWDAAWVEAKTSKAHSGSTR
jgi:hypothetical protein